VCIRGLFPKIARIGAVEPIIDQAGCYAMPVIRLYDREPAMSEATFQPNTCHAATFGILDVPFANRQSLHRCPHPRTTGPLGGDFRLLIRVMRDIPGSGLLEHADQKGVWDM
jgi:hypothetical protein